MLEVLSHHRMSFPPMKPSDEQRDSNILPPITTQLPDIFRESKPTFPVTPDSANEAHKQSSAKRKREESGSGDERPAQRQQLSRNSPVESRRKFSGSYQPYPPRHSAVTSPAQSQRVISPSTRSEPSGNPAAGHVRLPSINVPPPTTSAGSSHTSPHVSPLTRKGPTSIPASPPVREPLSSFIDPSRSSKPISLPPLRDLDREPPPYRGSDPQLPPTPTTISGETKYPSVYDSRSYRPPHEHPSGPPPPPAPLPPAPTTSTGSWSGSRLSNPGRSPITDRFYPSERPPAYGTSDPRSHHYDSRPPAGSRPYESYSSGPIPGSRPPDGYVPGSTPGTRGYEGYSGGPPPADRPDYSRQHPQQPAPPPPPPHHTRSHSHPQPPHQPLPPQQPPHMPYNSSYAPPPISVHGSSIGRPGEPPPLRSPLYPSSAPGSGQFSWEVGGVSDPYNRKRRGNLPKESTAILNTWFLQHIDHPYPKEEEKQNLQTQTGLTMSQISNWFINARRRRRPTALHRDPPGPGLEWDR